MVVITKKSSSSGGGGGSSGQIQTILFRNRLLLSTGALILLFAVWMATISVRLSSRGGSLGDFAPSSDGGGWSDFAWLLSAASEPAVPFREFRKSLVDQCEAASNVDEVMEVGESVREKFTLPPADIVDERLKKMRRDDEEGQRRRRSKAEDDDEDDAPRLKLNDDARLKRCKYVLMDFGANWGDTMAHMMDAGLVKCDQLSKIAERNAKSTSRFNQVDLTLVEGGVGGDPETDWLASRVERHASSLSKDGEENHGAVIGPEDYCYYGIEGNPHVAERLKKAEAWANSISPKPLRHAHFLTHTVGSGRDGHAQLWLNEPMPNMGANDENSTKAWYTDVQGVTLTTLMKRTLTAFDPKATEEDKKGGHLMIKVNIESGESGLAEEVAQSNALCDYAQMGNRADVIIEFDSKKLTDAAMQGSRLTGHREKLEKCGVKINE